MERPLLTMDSSTHAAVEAFLSLEKQDRLVDVGPILQASGGVTAWQFLCALAERREIAFHGTGDPSIVSFEPRRSVDFAPFGDQKAVFATTDPIWAMFYAIVDRARYELTPNNGCIPDTFVPQPAGTYAGHAARIPQLASPRAVAPFARLQVAPDDFPFLAHIRGHEDDRLAEYAQAVMSAAPWPT